MANVIDVATYILSKLGEISHMKLQKLVYYCQAWSLVWEDKPLFAERIEAWANGPVVPILYQRLKGLFLVKSTNLQDGNPDALSPTEQETIDRVLGFYSKQNSQWLSDLTHLERPWQDARSGLPNGARCEAEITQASMSEYYGSL